MVSRLQVLLQEQADLRGELRGISETIDRENRARNDAESERSGAIMERLGSIEGEVSREQAIREAMRHVASGPDADAIAEREAGSRVLVATDGPTPFKNFGQQLQAVKMAAIAPHAPDPRLLQIGAVVLGNNETQPSEGGFLVQTDFATELLRRVHETGILAGRTRRRTISSGANGLKINAIDETSRVDGSRYGGVQAYWTGEAEALTSSRPRFRQMELSLQKLTGLYYATDELLMDTTALAQEVGDWFSEEFGFKIDDALIRGTGAGMPLGILGHAGTVSISKETNQPAATVVKANLEKMFARTWARSLPNAEWFMNQDVWPQLFGLSAEVGVGGVPVFLPPGGISAAPFGMILGRPIVPIEQCATLGTVGDIIFADWNQYLTIEKGGIEAASSIHVQFLTGEETFRFVLRMDGQPMHNAPLTPFKGTNTLSSFVTLATRA